MVIIDWHDTYIKMGIALWGGIGILFLIGICIIGGYKLWYLGNRLRRVLRI